MSEHHELLEDEGAGYLISVSDMMSGLLLIFIITLVAFIINFQDAIQKQETTREQLTKKLREAEISKQLQDKVTETQKEVVRKLTDTEQIRNELLQKLKRELKLARIDVEIDTQHGVLRLTEKAVLFETAADTLKDKYKNNLRIIGRILSDVIPCYAHSPTPSSNCSDYENTKGKIDAIFIEGHTDNVPMRSARMKDNWELSVSRAIAAYHLVVPNGVLMNLRNISGQPIFSVSGYGEGRPVEGHNHKEPTADEVNRRIDLRFIMTPPVLTEPQRALIAKGVNT
ncbi:OmpA family protein [Vibrio parahaemolyticus]|uniref:OmpA family protein n=1 Tax=Vibrio parahaemolyticus TaxID=670 RepID=UPI0010EC8116|nr:OmpA family protein [Vibrio parahaemolyticus]HAS6111130.1 OmpA family protein [Vibrio vulnificus]EGQ8508555.1 OmpA family protein [Vibrio parahaemolyticus]EJG1692004.1 OmpA family protein [Vibrio parahaemolyticus]ELI5394928.1 OmpA family protein [Vibrio parahaemolyticus]MBE3735942.1 OmpA family protein [Vibrio parahaemolyticus]